MTESEFHPLYSQQADLLTIFVQCIAEIQAVQSNSYIFDIIPNHFPG